MSTAYKSVADGAQGKPGEPATAALSAQSLGTRCSCFNTAECAANPAASAPSDPPSATPYVVVPPAQEHVHPGRRNGRQIVGAGRPADIYLVPRRTGFHAADLS